MGNNIYILTSLIDLNMSTILIDLNISILLTEFFFRVKKINCFDSLTISPPYHSCVRETGSVRLCARWPQFPPSVTCYCHWKWTVEAVDRSQRSFSDDWGLWWAGGKLCIGQPPETASLPLAGFPPPIAATAKTGGWDPFWQMEPGKYTWQIEPFIYPHLAK